MTETKVHFRKEEPEKSEAETLAFFVFEGEVPGAARGIDAKLGGEVKKHADSDKFKGKGLEVFVHHTLGKSSAKRVMLIGLGKKEEFFFDQLRRAAAIGAIYARDSTFKSAVFVLPNPSELKSDARSVARGIVEGALLGVYRYAEFKTEQKEIDELKEKELKEITIIASNGINEKEAEEGKRIGEILGRSANYTRDLANAPSNILTPRGLAEKAAELAKMHGLKNSSIVGKEACKKAGFGALMAVNSGSDQDPAMIVLEYSCGKKDAPTIAVVGKGINFDSGGISIKPSKGMELMKHDKSGASAVLGIMDAASHLKLDVNLIGIAACTENMPSGSAYKPGDVVKTYSGKTIEILNTDAEGRVILSDALALAASKKPDAIIDMATLTGAVVIALGSIVSGEMGNNKDLLKQIFEAGEKSGERTWELPMYADYNEHVKSTIADVKNVGIGEAGPISGAKLLEKFIEKVPWVHLDIAGTAYYEKEKPGFCLGATGYGVRIVIQTLMDWKELKKEKK
ncbi:cytosol aminopeptidase [Candidatus Gugararchaeum adminiculabundum]|nr:cytosol aminopeptidase [Candidatus Gugararchaeum adminiculabundum]